MPDTAVDASELPKYLKAEQVSRLLDITEASLAQDRYRGEGIPYIKIGKRVRYERDDVLSYLEQNKVQTVPANRPARMGKMKRV